MANRLYRERPIKEVAEARVSADADRALHGITNAVEAYATAKANQQQPNSIAYRQQQVKRAIATVRLYIATLERAVYLKGNIDENN